MNRLGEGDLTDQSAGSLKQLPSRQRRQQLDWLALWSIDLDAQAFGEGEDKYLKISTGERGGGCNGMRAEQE